MSTLFVVFHGEIIFFDSCELGHPIYAYAPEIDIHVYSAGPWLAERMIPKGSNLELRGVDDGEATLKQCSDFLLTYPGAKPVEQHFMAENSHMQIKLPRPCEILSGGRECLSDVTIVLDDDTKVAPPDYGGLCVIFKYTFSTTECPALRIWDQDPGAKPAAKDPPPMQVNDIQRWESGGSLDGYNVLHVFAEADIEMPGDEHVRRAAIKGASLIGVNIKELRFSPGFAERQPVEAPRGLYEPEINLTLADRVPFLGGIGFLLHGNVDAFLQQQQLRGPRTAANPFIGSRQCAISGGIPSGG